jgi:CubicO group peptidase (beta-lactamase class C family)
MMRLEAVVAAVLAFPAWEALAQQTLPQEKIRQIEQAITIEMTRSTIPGVSVAVGSAAGLRWSSGYGMADLENLVPMTAPAEVRLGSISKPITATAVMQLVEKDKMQLDTPIQRYVPGFPEKQWPVTVRQLLGHLGGVRHYANAAEVDSTRHYKDRSEPLKIFAEDALLHEPDTKYSYTTYGFNLLGAAVESVSGMDYVDYLREKVFRPAGMDHAGPDDVFAIIPHRARGYRLTRGTLENCGLADTSNKIPGGGLISTADDLVLFALSLNAGRLVTPASRDLMFASQRTRDGKPTRYGMGWGIQELAGKRVVSHGGGQQGISTDLILLPDDGIAIAVMLNRENAPAAAIAHKVLEIVLRSDR